VKGSEGSEGERAERREVESLINWGVLGMRRCGSETRR